MRRAERELVEVELDGLDFTVVAHLVAEPEERVLDHPAHLRDRMQMADRQLLAGERDVDHLFAEPPVELLVGERDFSRIEQRLEPLPDAVQQHPALAVTHLAQAQRKLALTAEVLDTNIFERSNRRRRLSRAHSRLFVFLP